MNIENGDPVEIQLAALFDPLPFVSFYAKDAAGRFIRCNRSFEDFHSLAAGEAIGLTDYDLHPAEIANRYRAEDHRVMESTAPLPSRAWMVPDRKGVLHWCISSKTALRDCTGATVGVAGAMYEISRAGGMEPYARLEPALRMIHGDPSLPLRSATLAAACHYSESQFNRVFKQLIGLSPQHYVLRHRLEVAKGLLVRTDLPIAEIAGRAGFYDASVLGKKFREHEGLTPRQYRLKLLRSVEFGDGER